MYNEFETREQRAERLAPSPRQRERGLQLVALLTAAIMGLEIMVGYRTHSMALLADGWHMATHVGALGLASAAYWISRRFASHGAFAFGTGKVGALAGYTSAIALGLIAIGMVLESARRLLRPQEIDFEASLPVAVLGLVVNLVSIFLLHAHEDEDHDGEHDHNHRAAFMHIVADAFTSVLAIAGLLAGRFLGWAWLDAISGVVGGVVILKWGAGLSRNAALELLDVSPSSAMRDQIRVALEALDDVRVGDLRVWSLGEGRRGCVVTVETAAPRDVGCYRDALASFKLAHVTIEVRRCVARSPSEHGDLAL